MTCEISPLSGHASFVGADISGSYDPQDGTFSLSADYGVTGSTSGLTFGSLNGASDPVVFQWTISAIEDGQTIAVGLGDPSGDILGEGLRNILYLSNGILVVNGEEYATALTYESGDTVKLYYDGVNGFAEWWLNGELVA